MKKEYGSFVLLVLIGFAMSVTVLVKLFGRFNIDSDWFWFLAGVGLMAEGIVSLRRQKKFDKRFKVIEK